MCIRDRLQTLKNNGIPLIYTRHNTLPHHGNPLVAEAYGLVAVSYTHLKAVCRGVRDFFTLKNKQA